jgi:hypothetical protein
MQSGVAMSVAVLFLWVTSLAWAAEGSSLGRGEEVTAEAIIADGLLLRPGGLIATVLGTVAFVVTLPFSIPTKSVERAAQKLVVAPAKYTFTRPLGQLDTDRPPR